MRFRPSRSLLIIGVLIGLALLVMLLWWLSAVGRRGSFRASLPVNVAVTVSYRTDPTLAVELTAVEYTAGRETISFYGRTEKSVAQSNQFRLRLVDERGRTLSEYPFGLTTEIVLEDFENLTARSLTLAEGSEYLVVPPAQETIASVQLVRGSGEIVDSAVVPPLSFRGALPLVGSRLTAFLAASPGRSTVSEQTAAEESADPFTLAVLSDRGVPDNELEAVKQQALEMMRSIHPWSKYSTQVEVLPNADVDLGCELVVRPGRQNALPVCYDILAIMKIVSSRLPNADGVVVAVSHPHSGGVAYRGALAFVTTAVDQRAIAHELGHTVGLLTDEYAYRESGYEASPGPNCFATMAACAAATRDFPDAECSLGCNRQDTYRPATRLMHDTKCAEYGPFEACEVEKWLRVGIGLEEMVLSSDLRSYEVPSFECAPAPPAVCGPQAPAPPQPPQPTTETAGSGPLGEVPGAYWQECLIQGDIIDRIMTPSGAREPRSCYVLTESFVPRGGSYPGVEPDSIRHGCKGLPQQANPAYQPCRIWTTLEDLLAEEKVPYCPRWTEVTYSWGNAVTLPVSSLLSNTFWRERQNIGIRTAIQEAFDGLAASEQAFLTRQWDWYEERACQQCRGGDPNSQCFGSLIHLKAPK